MTATCGDHIYRGSYLFPTVFGLEAMTQAVAVLTGESLPSVIRIENVALERPIVVNPQDGVVIEVRALALEASHRRANARSMCSIRTEQTRLRRRPFLGRAGARRDDRWAGGPPPTAATATLGLDPKADLYDTGLLFQGPLFQRMGPIYELDGDHTIFASESRAGQEDACRRGRTDGRRSGVGKVEAGVGQADVIDDAHDLAGGNVFADGGVDVVAEGGGFSCACRFGRGRES